MSIEHDTGKGRQLETASSSGAVETDEQLARRLHEELNALTRHSRRAAPAPGSQQQLQRSKSEKLPDSKTAKPSSKQRVQSDAEAQLGSMLQHNDKVDKPARKRAMLNRELAMLVTDMVDSNIKPAIGPRQTKSKDEQVVDQHRGGEQQQQQLQAVEQLLPILKHESSSSQSEQERLALEHVQAAVADGTPHAKQAQQRPHFMARASDSGADAAGDSACISGAESSGRDSSSSSGEPDHGQQHTSPAALDQRRQPDREQPRSRQQQPQQQRHAPAQPKGKQQDAAVGKVTKIKIPKLPMVEYAKKWYRAKVLKDACSKVLLEYQGYSHEGGPFWLAKDHSRIWRGSYKGRDWKYLGDGAWEPKAGKCEGKSRRTKTHRSSSAAAATATAAGDGAAAADSDTEQLAGLQQRRQVLQQRHKKQKQPHRRAAAAAAAAGSLKQEPDGRADGTVSERDTTSADQQGEAADVGDAVGPSAVEQGEVDSGMQLDEPCKQEQDADAPKEAAKEQDCVAQPAEADAAVMDVDQQEDGQAGADAQQQEADAAGEDQRQQQEQEVQADEQPEGPSAEQCNRAALIRSGSSRVAGAVDAAAAAAAEVDAAAAVKQEVLEATAASGATAALVAAPAAAVVSAAEAPADAGKPAVGKGKPITAPVLVGHTHEEMVAAAAAAVAVAAPPAPHGRAARGARSNSARAAGDGVSEGVTKRCGRGGRGGRGAAAAAAAQVAAAAARAAAAAAAAAAKEQQARQEQQQQAQQVQQPAASGSASGSGQLPANLRVEPGRALKHSGSSEGPLSPTSPSGGSPRVNSRRRKGVPRRARLDSEDLQRPTKKARGAPKPSAYCDTAMEWQQHEQQVQRQHMLEQQRQQAQLAAQQQQAAWRAAAKNGCGSSSSAKKSIWSLQQQGDLSVGVRQARQQNCWQQEQQQQFWGQPSPRQQTLAAAAAAAAAAEYQAVVAEQQQQLMLQQTKMKGSEQEDVEAACVLLGAAMGRAHSGEVLDSTAPALSLQLMQRSFSMTAADEMHLSPRFTGAGRQGTKRRGHNWSKPLSNTSRPPRPPAQAGAAQQLQHPGFRHSLNGSLPQPQRRTSFSDADLGLEQEQHSYGALGSAALAGAGDASAALLGRQGAVGVSAAVLKPRNGSCAVGGDSDGKQETLRTLLDAVGQLQSASGRPDLMYPLQFGGVPMGTQAPGKDGRNSVLPLQLLHTPVSAAAATLLAAVPSLDAVQRMAVLQGQGGVLACLTGESPALFL